MTKIRKGAYTFSNEGCKSDDLELARIARSIDPRADAKALNDDQRWFRKHTRRRYRLRKSFEGESVGSPFVLIKRLIPRGRMRVPIPFIAEEVPFDQFISRMNDKRLALMFDFFTKQRSFDESVEAVKKFR